MYLGAAVVAVVGKVKDKIMVKNAVKTEAAPKAPEAPVVRTTRAVPGTLQVKQGVKLRGAREAWYIMLQKHNGKPAQEFLDTCTKTPPSVPKSGRPEAPSGWLSYFVRTGVATIKAPEKADK